jgi:hypothetical protein
VRVFALKLRAEKADKRIRIRVFMFGRFRHFLPAACLLGAATLWADTGYLPLAGPVPLRFRVLPPPVVEPASPPVPPAPIELPVPPKPVESKEPMVIPPIQPVTNGPPLEFNAREPAIGSAPVMAPDAAVSPQMLIKFFTGSPGAVTNSSNEKVMAPVGFTPPVTTPNPPAPPAPSKP